MSTFMDISRRRFLAGSGALGCSLAASPLITPMAFAAAPGEGRLVVIILRGGMDGLDAIRPLGDPDYDWLRPSLTQGEAPLPLDGFFALHPALDKLHGLWGAGELGFAHAVSTPYRDKRSHFDGQDLLEAGVGMDGAIRDGWLNRALAQLPGAELRTAFAVGREQLLILSGGAQVSSWAPDAALTLSPQSRRLLDRLYEGAPLFEVSLTEAVALAQTLDAGGLAEGYDEAREAMVNSMQGAGRGNGIEKIARFTAERLREETRIASFSINGWDTHTAQKNGLARALRELQTAIMTLRGELGPVWQKTAVLAVTEFGRTAAENGSGGTDHGTGGAMLMAGGAVRGGRAFGHWPGLDEASLYDRRDLMPTADLRAYSAAALQGLFGLETGVLEGEVFPGLDMGETPAITR